MQLYVISHLVFTGLFVFTMAIEDMHESIDGVPNADPGLHNSHAANCYNFPDCTAGGADLFFQDIVCPNNPEPCSLVDQKGIIVVLIFLSIFLYRECLA